MSGEGGGAEASLVDLRKRQLELSREIHMEQKRQRRAELRESSSVGHALHEAGVASFDSEDPGSCEEVGRLFLLGEKIWQVLMVLVLANFETDVAVSFALGRGRPAKYQSPGYDYAEPDVRRNVAAGIDWAYFMAPMDLLEDLLECTWRVDMAAVWDAAKYVVEYRLFYWCVCQNCDKGVEPDNLSMYKAAANFVPREAPAGIKDKLRHYFLAADRTARYWVDSFRDRWGAYVGKLRQGSPLEQEEVERKDAWPC